MQFNPKHAVIPVIFVIYLTMLIGYVSHTPKTTISQVEVAASPQKAAQDTTPQRPPITLTPGLLQKKAKLWLLQRIHLQEWLCIKEIIYRESRWIPDLKNPTSTAFGLGQVKGSKAYTLGRPMKQFKLAVRYAIHKHSTLCQALDHHNKYGWY